LQQNIFLDSALPNPSINFNSTSYVTQPQASSRPQERRISNDNLFVRNVPHVVAQ